MRSLALPLLARGAAMRFLLTRLVDWLNVPEGALVRPKDPLEYFRKLRFHQKAESVRDYGLPAEQATHDDGAECHHPHRRRLLGQSRTRRLGRDPDLRRPEKELSGGEAHTTNNRMELMAAIAALEALKRPCTSSCTPTASICATDLRLDSWLEANGWKTADKKPVKNADLWKRLDAALKPRGALALGQGPCRPRMNERADVLAREGMAMARLKQR